MGLIDEVSAEERQGIAAQDCDATVRRAFSSEWQTPSAISIYMKQGHDGRNVWNSAEQVYHVFAPCNVVSISRRIPQLIASRLPTTGNRSKGVSGE